MCTPFPAVPGNLPLLAPISPPSFGACGLGPQLLVLNAEGSSLEARVLLHEWKVGERIDVDFGAQPKVNQGPLTATIISLSVFPTPTSGAA